MLRNRRVLGLFLSLAFLFGFFLFMVFFHNFFDCPFKHLEVISALIIDSVAKTMLI